MAFLLGTTMTTVAQTAGDSYLDVANHATINSVGWSNNYVTTLYAYTEYEDEKVAWLTMSVYGAVATCNSYSTAQNQQWVTTPSRSMKSGRGASTNRWIGSNGSSSYPFMGSSTYFETPSNTCRWGYTSTSSTNKDAQIARFHITNVNQVKIYGKNYNASQSYPSIIRIYECTNNNDGTLTRGSQVGGDKKYTSKSDDFTYTSDDLDLSKIYEIECTVYRGALCEIAFCTPLVSPAVITAVPTSLDFETFVGESAKKTINVKGTSLQGDISATITDDNGNVFSVPATISQADASASDGTNVTVTFSPTQAGTYTGTLTLSSQGAIDVAIPLTGKANDYFPVNITSVGLTTLYLDSPLKIPYDEYEPNILGVYYIYGLNGKELLSARLENTIPAKTGVIIQGNSGEYKFPIIEEADPLPSVAPNSLLSGCLEETPVSTVKDNNVGAKIYTLGRGKDTYINFYQYSGQMLHANKAFYLLKAAGNAKELSVRFDDQATGIRTASTLVDDGAWYTIQGIRLQGEPAAKGLYIHNGKTIVVK